MEEDDPWDWSIDRVVEEFCTHKQSWRSSLAPASRPNPALLERALREHEVKGCILLVEVDDMVMRHDFGLNVLGHRAFLRAGIFALRDKSAQYKGSSHPRHLMPPSGGFGHNELEPQPGVALEQLRSSIIQLSADMLAAGTRKTCPEPTNSSQEVSSSSGLIDRHTANNNHMASDASNATRHKLNTEGTSTIPEPEFEMGNEGIVDHSSPRANVLRDGDSDSTPTQKTNNFTTIITNGTKKKRMVPTLITSEIDTSRKRYIATDADNVVHNAPQTMKLGIPHTDDDKKRKRVAPTLIISEVDPHRNRDLPTEADNTVHNDPQAIEPGVSYIGNDGRKRLVPIHQPDLQASQPNQSIDVNWNGVPQVQEQESSVKKQAVVGPIVSKPSHKQELKICTDSFATGYLGKRKMCVDDIFYKGIPVGDDLPTLSSDREFSQGLADISSGRRIYVHDIMKHFLRTERQDFVRGGRLFSAVLPYSIELAPRFQNPSFTLFHSTPDGKIHATRAEVPSWPEIDPEASVHQSQKIGVENVARFNLPGPGVLTNLSSYNEWDPSQLEKYQLLEGAEEVLPLYGDSDSENEYDEALWREIEDEQGLKLKKPSKPTRKQPLDETDVNTAIDEGISELLAKWKLKNFPKLDIKAYRIWQKARNTGAWRVDIAAARERLNHITQRLIKMREEILHEVWSSAAQVRRQTTIMEQTISDREELRWKIAILEKKRSPAKPVQLISAPKLKKRKVPNEGIQGESIESDTDTATTDDGLDDFIINDGPITTEEELELNLADIERSDDDSILSDVSLTESLSVRAGLVKAGTALSTTGLPSPLVQSGLNPLQRLQSRTASPAPIKPEPSLPIHPASRVISPSEIVDLTQLSSDDGPRAINLVTPKRKKPLVRLINRNSPLQNPIMISDEDDTGLRNRNQSLFQLTHPASIAQHPTHVWESRNDRKRLLISVLYKMSSPSRDRIFDLILDISEEELWANLQEAMSAHESSKSYVKGMDKSTFETLTIVLRLFETFIDCKYHPYREAPRRAAIKKLQASRAEWFSLFYKVCCRISNNFDGNSAFSQTSGTPRAKKRANGDGVADGNVSENSNGQEGDDEDGEPVGSVRRRRNAGITTSGDEDETPRKKKRKLFEDAQARHLREQDRRRLAEQEERRMRLQSNLARSGHGRDEEYGRIIVNDAKADDQGYILVHPQIAQRIKKHQIEGLRFMWNQIVAGGNSGQGCLLAHTMGLGKTMQVITLLVTIAQASASSDMTVVSQIPKRLRESRTIVLCPPGLIDNWMDELLTWAPPNILGRLLKVDASVKLEDRLPTISTWYKDGGVLVMGYEMFRGILRNRPRKGVASLSDEQYAEVSQQLFEGPNIIIADEAHKLKNAKAALTLAANGFQSKSRIALTGSPLANNVEEYHTMIDWVAPNYLGPIREFREKYAEPIQLGLWQDSTSFERRKSLKMLGVLKEDIAPKVNRADMSVLRNDLPPKKEFVITVPLTELQRKAYSLYVQSMASGSGHSRTKDGEVTQTTLWHWLTVLSLLCNHPECFRAKLHERKEDAKKVVPALGDVPSPREDGDLGEAIASQINEPIWKVGVSQELINDETKLFCDEGVDIKSPHLSNKIRILCQILDASKDIGDKVLVFSQSIPTLDFIEDLCKSQGRTYARLDGKTTMSKRQGETKAFNRGGADLYLISTAAGGLGLNLPGANRVVIFDFKFNPIMEEQAIGRAYRIGQKKPTFVYRFIAGGTFEGTVHNKTVFKMQLASRVVDKKNPIAYAKKKMSDFLFEPLEIEQKDLSEFIGMDPHVLDKLLLSQDDAGCIHSIVQSDTFERDDDDKLTAEEEKEVRQLLSDEQLKRTDPAAWQRKNMYQPPVNHEPVNQAPVQHAEFNNGSASSYVPRRREVPIGPPPGYLYPLSYGGGLPLQTNTLPSVPNFPAPNSASPTAGVGNETASGMADTARPPANNPQIITSARQSPVLGANTIPQSHTPENTASQAHNFEQQQPKQKQYRHNLRWANENKGQWSEDQINQVCNLLNDLVELRATMPPPDIRRLLLIWEPNFIAKELAKESIYRPLEPRFSYLFPVDFTLLTDDQLRFHLNAYKMGDQGTRQDLLRRCYLLERGLMRGVARSIIGNEQWRTRTLIEEPPKTNDERAPLTDIQFRDLSQRLSMRGAGSAPSLLSAPSRDHPMLDAGSSPRHLPAPSEDHPIPSPGSALSLLSAPSGDHPMPDAGSPPLHLPTPSEDHPVPSSSGSASQLPARSEDHLMPNSATYKAMNKKPVSSLRTPVTKRAAAEADTLEARRLAERRRARVVSTQSTNSPNSTPSLPKWARDELSGSKSSPSKHPRR